MNRIHLRLFVPTEETVAPEQDYLDMERPHILPFRPKNRTTILSGRFTAPAERARVIRENGVCPECDQSDIEPLELEDAVLSQRNHRPIPGTATIVGFHCNSCSTEWPVYELTTRRNG